MMWQRKLDCDILVYGGTHKFRGDEVNGKYLINPGSITGACSPTDPDPTPSFVLMDISVCTPSITSATLRRTFHDDAHNGAFLSARNFVEGPCYGLRRRPRGKGLVEYAAAARSAGVCDTPNPGVPPNP